VRRGCARHCAPTHGIPTGNHPTPPDEAQQNPLGSLQSPRGFSPDLTFKSQVLCQLS